MMVMVMALILLAFPHEHRGKAMGVVSLVIGFAPAVGPSIGGVIVDGLGWRALFVIVAILSAIVIVIGFKNLSNSNKFPQTKFDFFNTESKHSNQATLLLRKKAEYQPPQYSFGCY